MICHQGALSCSSKQPPLLPRVCQTFTKPTPSLFTHATIPTPSMPFLPVDDAFKGNLLTIFCCFDPGSQRWSVNKRGVKYSNLSPLSYLTEMWLIQSCMNHSWVITVKICSNRSVWVGIVQLPELCCRGGGDNVQNTTTQNEITWVRMRLPEWRLRHDHWCRL